MYKILRNILFCLPAEASHTLALQGMDFAHATGLLKLIKASKPAVSVETQVMGLRFPNPVGLAAGLDKNADHIDALAALGFGFLEVGTLTPRPQPGNAKPRLFRLREQQAIINRMGFNNKGIDYALQQIRRSRFRGILGINIGKNFDTPVQKAADDYLLGLRKAYAHASYIVVNLSSPNTPGLRTLQLGEEFRNLLSVLKAEQRSLHMEFGRYVPLVVKIAPDLAPADLISLAETLLDLHIDGVIATNTTLDRSLVQDSPWREQAGGLSGAPLTERATEVVRVLSQVLCDRIPIIAVGGIMQGADAAAKIAAGAALVQIYSGFIYAGPPLITDSINAIAVQRGGS